MSERPRLYLDADMSPRIAEIGRGLGLDVISAHEIGMADAEDADQLARAASDGRVMVTRNRDDFFALTIEAYHNRSPHGGLLIVAAAGGKHGRSRTAHSLAGWAKRTPVVEPYSVHWLRVG